MGSSVPSLYDGVFRSLPSLGYLSRRWRLAVPSSLSLVIQISLFVTVLGLVGGAPAQGLRRVDVTVLGLVGGAPVGKHRASPLAEIWLVVTH